MLGGESRQPLLKTRHPESSGTLIQINHASVFTPSLVSIAVFIGSRVTEPICEHLGLALRNSLSKPKMPSQRALREPGEHFGRHLDLNDPNDHGKSVDGIFEWDQGLRVAMHAAC
jgi:hypothetical protein